MWVNARQIRLKKIEDGNENNKRLEWINKYINILGWSEIYDFWKSKAGSAKTFLNGFQIFHIHICGISRVHIELHTVAL